MAWQHFSTRGYGATTMRDIANDAGVALQTVYSSIGPKRAILSAFIDQMEEEAGLERVGEEYDAARTPQELLDMRARHSRRIYDAGIDTIDMLYRSAGTAPEIQETIAEGNRRHRESITQRIIRRLPEDSLHEGLSVTDATDIIATLSGADVYRWLVRSYGWSPDAYETWLARTLRQAVLHNPTG